MFNHTSKKFLLGFFGILLVALLVWVGGTYFNPEVREKRALVKYFEDIAEEYKNDTYGGATPEETLELFIAALEAEDIELASKYFLPDEREKWTQIFKDEFDVGNNFDYLIAGLKKLKLTGEIKDGKAFFIVVDEDDVVANQVVIKKNENNVWKITEL